MADVEETKRLLVSRTDSPGAGYGVELTSDMAGGRDSTPEISEHDKQVTGDGEKRTEKKKRPWWRREKKIQRNPSLDKVDEASEQEAKEEPKRKSFSDYIGVKSYLHDFYDSHVFKDPELYEDEDDFRYLLHPNPRRRHCTSIWWKVFVWIGANFLIFGLIGVMVGYLVPQKPVLIDTFEHNLKAVNREAISFNYHLDVCKLVGLILFCVGGLTLAAALLFPSFFYKYCDEDHMKDPSFKILTGEQEPLRSPVEMVVPASGKVAEIQPFRKADESVATMEGMVTYEK